MKITMATSADVHTLTNIGRKTFTDTFEKYNNAEDMQLYLKQTFSYEIQLGEVLDPNRRIAIIWVDNVPVGYFHLLIGETPSCVNAQKPIELLRFYIDTNWHGKGIAQSLMDKCITVCRNEGFKTLWLGVWENNIKAQSFYQKYSFYKVGEHTFMLGRDPQNDIIMQKLLS